MFDAGPEVARPSLRTLVANLSWICRFGLVLVVGGGVFELSCHLVEQFGDGTRRRPAGKDAGAQPGEQQPRPRRVGRLRGYGHSADGTSVVEAEAAAIREAAGRVLGGETLSAVVRDWNRRGMVSATGGPWRIKSLSNLLVQPRLCADPPILDPDTHDRLVALNASRRKGPRRATRRYLLTGLLRCSRCGASLRGATRAPGADVYICPGSAHGGCSGTAITADLAEECVAGMVLDRLGRLSADDSDDGSVREEVGAQRRRLFELGELWAAGELDRDEWLSLRRSVGRRLRMAEAEVAQLDRRATLRRMAANRARLLGSWSEMGMDERREVVHAMLRHVVVLPAVPPKQVFRPDRLDPVWRDSGPRADHPSTEGSDTRPGQSTPR